MVPQRRRFDTDLDALTDRAAARMWNVYPGYSQDRFPRAELEPSVRGNLDLAVRVVRRGTGPVAAELAAARELGERRAGQGVPLESIIQAYRQTERVMVLDVLQLSRSWPVAEAEAVTDLVIGTFDDLTDAMIVAYRDASSALEVERRRVEEELVSSLAGGVDVGAARLERWVRLLGLDADGTWRAVALQEGGPGSAAPVAPALRRRVPGAAGVGVRHVLLGRSERVLMVLVCVTAPAGPSAAVVRSLFAGLDVGAPLLGGMGGPARSLAAAGVSCRQARDALRVAGPAARTGAVTLVDHADVLVDVMVDAHPAVAGTLADAVLRPLRPFPYLVDTLVVLLRCNLSQSATARELYLHANTVAHRLHRIHQLTGRNPTRFPDVVEIALALRWQALQGDGPPQDGPPPTQGGGLLARP